MSQEKSRKKFHLSIEDLEKSAGNKVMILTLLYTVSVGAVLQAQALQQTLTDLGIENELANYKCEKVYRASLPALKQQKKSFLQTLKAVAKYPIQKERYEKFRSYEKQHLNIMEWEFEKEKLMLAMIKMGISYVLIGSDQVWNTTLTGHDTVFLGAYNLHEDRKYSYGASIGTETIPFEYENSSLNYIRQFAGINVREKTTQEYLTEKRVHNVSCGIDPTLLVEKEQWKQQIGERLIKEPYIFIHMMEEKKENFTFVKDLAKRTGRKIYWMNNRIKGSLGMEMLRTAGPEEFLNYMYYADCVVTGSFHGLCFSLIFQKEFYYTMSPEKGRNIRITDLATLFSFENREIVDGNVQENVPIDYVHIEEIRKREKKKSLEYLSLLKQEVGSEKRESL